MSEEKKMILNMLREGKITDEEALKLLDAIANKSQNSEEQENINTEKFESNVNNFVNKILSGIEKGLNKAGEAINNLDIDLSSLSFSDIKYNGNATKTTRIENIDDKINLFLNNPNGKIQVYKSTNDFVEIVEIVNFDESLYNQNSEFLQYKTEENNHYYGIDINKNNKNFTSQLIVTVPDEKIENLKAKSSNSKIMIDNLQLRDIILETTNGKIEVNNVISNEFTATTTNSKIEAKNVTAAVFKSQTTNGKIETNEIKADKISANTTNGKIVLAKVNSQNIDAHNTNGAIYLSVPNTNPKNINLSSTNAGIYIEGLDYSKPIMAEMVGRLSEDSLPLFSKIEKSQSQATAYTENYVAGAADTINIKVETSNGKISIK